MTSKKQERPEVPKSRIPTFQSIEEEAAFWDTHSSEEFADELTPVEDVKFVKAGAKRALTVRFDEDTFEELSRERSEEHTSELQSRLHLVCRLLLEKKKKVRKNIVLHRSIR